MKGSVFKRCSCRDPETRKPLHKRCPKLKTKGHGKWWYRYDAPRGADGKRRQPMGGPYDTQKQAQDALTAELARVGGGGPALDRSVKVGPYLWDWLASKVNLAPDTYDSYEEAIRLYFEPALGHHRLVDLRDHHVAEMVREMGKINRTAAGDKPSETLRRMLDARADDQRKQLPDGERRRKRSTRPLSPARIKRIMAVLQSALNYAVKGRRIPGNPAEHVPLPKARKRKPVMWTAPREAAWRAEFAARLAEAKTYRKRTGRTHPMNIDVWRSTPRPAPVMVWTAAQTGEFLDFAADDRLYPLIHLVTFYGLRRAEVAGLLWAEVDLEEGTVTVRDVVDDDLDLDDPKSEAGIRTIVLDEETVRVLRAWKRRQAAERLAAGELWTDTGLVFTRDDGRKLRDEGVSERFESLAYRSGLPPVRFHDLRHGAASLGLKAGADFKVVSERLGHSRSSFTRDVYTTVEKELAQQAAEATARAVPRARRRPS